MLELVGLNVRGFVLSFKMLSDRSAGLRFLIREKCIRQPSQRRTRHVEPPHLTWPSATKF